MRRFKHFIFTITTVTVLASATPSWAQEEEVEGIGFLESYNAIRYLPLLAVAGIGILLDQILESHSCHNHGTCP
ncbi:hypothetical protein SCG7086_AD_00270 [Chlamydiales bacterium SCGC AG-110-P3]|nr:hypothetical protein SCG7086_AD_00270 [Chlamydiales bacterium SCGC AG-110-P3]